MYIPNDITQNYPFCRLLLVVYTQLNEPTNHNSIDVPKFVKPENKKCCYKTLWTSAIDSPMSPPSLVDNTDCIIY